VTKLLALLALIAVFFIAGNSQATVATETIILNDKNSVRFNEEFSDMYVAKIQGEVAAKVSRLAFDEPLYLVMDSPGGSVFAGAVLIDNLKALGHPIHTITVFSASMGYQLVQNMGTRYILPSGVLMSHRAAGRVQGQFYGEVESRTQMIKDMVDILDEVAAERTKTSIQEYRKSVQNELWAVGSKAVDANQADAIAKAVCDKSLRGTESRTVRTFFGPVELIFSKCPIITAPIDFKLPGDRTSDLDAEEYQELHNKASQYILDTYTNKAQNVINGTYGKQY
jgi:ATP-dependent Clp protease protease subunit